MIRCDKCGHEMRDDWTRWDDSTYSRVGGNCTLSGLNLCYDCAHGFDDDGASIAVRLDHAEARVRELEAELSHSILDATAVLVEGKAKAEARVRRLETALVEISTTFPSPICMNGNSYTSDPDYVKMSNNHMLIARAALAGGKE